MATILLVEDNLDNRAIYRTILEFAGHRVVEAHNGEEGIRMAREVLPDLILMDVSIPIVDGWQATTILKGDPLTAAIPIVALTAHALPADRDRSLAAGCDGYLAKPVEPRVVAQTVERFLAAPEAGAPPAAAG